MLADNTSELSNVTANMQAPLLPQNHRHTLLHTDAEGVEEGLAGLRMGGGGGGGRRRLRRVGRPSGGGGRGRRAGWWDGKKVAMAATATCLATVLLYSMAFLPMCNVYFRCGCKPLWDGGSAQCNVHSDVGPKCPQCAAPPSVGWIPMYGGAMLSFATTLAVGLQCSGCWSWRWLRWATWPVTLLASFFGYSFIIAVFFRLGTDYPYFLTGPDHPKERIL